ncbi:MAG: YidC/Oxa1 family rane protein insertase [Frankiaceae bacterium]|nr:YidC/Oxa1 family rane protein insertase [Frankiaceae bacterium]
MLDPFYNAIAWLIVKIHSGMAPIFGAGSGAAWALSIVLLTMAMRLLLFPLFVKQIKSQRAMSALQPQMKELQAKYKNDKEKLNQEMMALWREHGTNPLAGCLPVIVQIPVFFALFRVLNSLHPNKGCVDVNAPHCFSPHFNGILTEHLTHQASLAKVFGVPIGASFSSSSHTLKLLSASATSVKTLSALLIVLMAASTFITQRQLMARNAASGMAQMPQQQKTLLYVLPVIFAGFGFKFPLGVLLYWLTTNFWSMAQQAVVIRRMDAAPAAAGAGPATTVQGPPPGARPGKVRPQPALLPETPPTPAPAPKSGANGAKPAPSRPPANRRKKRKGGRR